MTPRRLNTREWLELLELLAKARIGWRRLLIVAVVLALLADPAAARRPRLVSDADRDYVASVFVHEHESPDPANRFFDVSFRNDGDDDGNRGVPHVGIITPKASALAEWLAAHDGQRVALSLRAGGRLTRDGDER
jgi:hypothetical protein